MSHREFQQSSPNNPFGKANIFICCVVAAIVLLFDLTHFVVVWCSSSFQEQVESFDVVNGHRRQKTKKQTNTQTQHKHKDVTIYTVHSAK